MIMPKEAKRCFAELTVRVRIVADCVVADYVRGMRIKDIQRKYGISEETMYKILSRRGVKLRGKGCRAYITTADLMALVDYLKGAKIEDLPVSKWRLIKIKQFFGIPRRRKDLDDKRRREVIETLENFLRSYNDMPHLPTETAEELRRKVKNLLK
ncbi:hypothetical protein DRP04_06325 [Archaeoglobales archaeon]|nr:MAG: hypothetical protein DRP04_06325 [Archaeoglobales archaeon]